VLVVRREHRSLWSPAVGAEGSVLAYGHYGRPVLAFPSEAGHAYDYEDRGMVDAVAGLIEAGRAKLYCVDSFDGQSWVDPDRPLEDRARQHLKYEDWILNQVVPFIYDDCRGRQDIVVNGPSLGAFHAANFALKRADLFPLAICLSGVYDVSRFGWGERGDTFYFNNPMDYVANLHGDHLAWLQSRLRLVLVCGQGRWEDSTGALDSTRRFAGLLRGKQIDHALDLWGFDMPHDWPSWRTQLAHHLDQVS